MNQTIRFIALTGVLGLFFSALTGCGSQMDGVADNNMVHVLTPDTHPDAPRHTDTPPPAPKAQAHSESRKSEPSRVSDSDKSNYLEAINAVRKETQDCGDAGVFDPAPALQWDDRLGNAAWEHSNDLAQSDTFSHDGSHASSDTTSQDLNLSRGSHFEERIRHHDYRDYRTIAENIAGGFDTAQDAVDDWLQSDEHCANLMNPDFVDVGMALIEKDGTDYGTYWTLELGGK